MTAGRLLREPYPYLVRTSLFGVEFSRFQDLGFDRKHGNQKMTNLQLEIEEVTLIACWLRPWQPWSGLEAHLRVGQHGNFYYWVRLDVITGSRGSL